MTTIDYRATFFTQFAELCKTPMFIRMQQTVEGSPWHREANVLVHTEMVVNEYVKMVDIKCVQLGCGWTRSDYLGAIAAAFHDTGKPSAEIEKFSEERGTYRAYHGHELLSARKFETYAVSQFPMFSAYEIAYVCWMIENHMPWQIEDHTKRVNMAMTAKWFGADTFCAELLADQFGRTADDQAQKNSSACSWVTEFLTLVNEVQLPFGIEPLSNGENSMVNRQDNQPVFWMPIAPSGAGKSTFLHNLQQMQTNPIDVFSLDLLRHEFYHPTDYALAFAGAMADKNFEARANARFHAVAEKCASTGTDLFVDNTNLSAKRRKFYLTVAKKLKFKTVAVLMPVSLDVLLARQHTRTDKTVPDNAVKQHYRSLQMPMLGEFDQIIVSDHNLEFQ